MVKNQLTKQEARRLFDYRDGMLYWRHAGSGRRGDLRAVTNSVCKGRVIKIVRLGRSNYLAKYLVWNWHHGIASSKVQQIDKDVSNISIDNLFHNEEFITRPQHIDGRAWCPCCSQLVPVPSPEIVSANCGLAPIQQKILEAVWAGRGFPVSTRRIFDKMYEDDPDGGPPESEMYNSFKSAKSRMKSKLAGSGYGIVNDGYGRGYRLVIGKEEEDGQAVGRKGA
ncbi:hypothetical protein [Breoghania sp.]|uniref:hypothetical protein n=1 Tax=Breoghania sp. TaxID=2065378 RepID=UPI002AA6D3BA|nr:hypothetical protein [Breoghania sp.]